MNVEEMYLKEELLSLGFKEASIIVEKKTEENIMINQGMNSNGLHQKEDYLLPGIKVSFLAIVLLVITLDIKL
jgi:hypothetical protein